MKRASEIVAAGAAEAAQTDGFIARAIVVFLGVAVLVGLGGGIYLAAFAKNIPDALIAITSGALGGLTGVLVRLNGK